MSAITTPFATGDSPVHRLDARVRLVAAVVFTLPVALSLNPYSAISALCIGLFLVTWANLPRLNVLRRLLLVNAFIAFLWIFLPFSTPGHTAFKILSLNVTHEGIALATLITAKSNAIVLTLMALMGTIAVQDLGPAMQKLKVPNKFCHILLFTYRYIHVIHQEYTTMRRAMTARGFIPATNRHTYRTYAWLVGMILVKSWDRAERVHGAMRCRGFHGRFYSLTEFKTTTRDTLFLGGCMLATVCILFLELSYRIHA